jgi:formylglycine-generating enzyme required for sulfatase activity
LKAFESSRGMRVYCHIHKRSFSAEILTPVICERGKHILGAAPNDPTESDLWEYCCNCQNFWLVNPDGPGASQCPVCERPPTARYLCEQCHTLTLEALGSPGGREFFLSLQGAPRPCCPGCLKSENKPLIEHTCDAYAARFTTARQTCPFCQKSLAAVPAFPMSVAKYLSKFKGEKLAVAFDAESRQLVNTEPGTLLLLVGENGFGGQILLPRLSHFDSEQQFFQLYQDYYLCDAPAAGEVIIVYPATAIREGSNWGLKDLGRLRIDPGPREEAAEPARTVQATVTAAPDVPAEAPHLAGPEPASADRAAVPIPVPTEAGPGANVLVRALVIAVVTLAAILVAAVAVSLIVIQRGQNSPVTRDKPPVSEPNKVESGQTSEAGMVYIPGGVFTMGSDEGDEYERPAHVVTLKPFFIDALEVSCGEYAKFVSATDRQPPAAWTNGACRPGTEQHPVTDVDWYDASAYASWAGKRLPTEEEWECAARGFDQRKYPWGNEWRVGAANAGDSSAGEVVDVGSNPAGKSPFGAMDLAGNAWEWTASDLKFYPGSRLTRRDAERKVIRGGSWAKDNPPDWTTTFRGFAAPSGGNDYSKIGFRCARDASAKPGNLRRD